MSKSTQTNTDFSIIVATNAELARNAIQTGQLVQQKDSKYIESLEQRYLLCLRNDELKGKVAQLENENRRLQNQIDSSIKPPQELIGDLIEFEGK